MFLLGQRRLTSVVALLSCLFFVSQVRAINVVVDYTYDSDEFLWSGKPQWRHRGHASKSHDRICGRFFFRHPDGYVFSD